MRTCGAFADLGFDVRLIALRVSRPDGVPRNRVWSHFGIPATFRIRVMPTPLSHASSVRAFRVWGGLASLVTAITSLARQAVRARPLVVYARSPILMAPFALLRRALPRSRRPRLVFETHSLPPQSTWPLMRLADLVVVNSQKLADDVVERAGIPREHALYVPLGPYVDIRQHPKDRARASVGLPDDAAIACYSGKMFEDLSEFMLQIARQVNDRVRNFRLLLVGGNPAVLEWTQRRVAELGLQDAVILTGFVEPHKVELYQAAADALLFYVKDTVETFEYCTPSKGFEYQAAGRPIVAADIPLFEEVFGEEGERAIRVKEHTPEAMARAIEEALAMDDADPMIERAATWVRSRTWARRAEMVAQALHL
jgi:glycosyltransferase involved in cell wall biosynthesis